MPVAVFSGVVRVGAAVYSSSSLVRPTASVRVVLVTPLRALRAVCSPAGS